ncbi:MAG: hypothetical protein QGI10_01510 [Vicinamibacterales bacterium]|jgi:hypothetical protein|nr:hypothetical protein [Vicinamibacterales bacterium]HJN43903.1 hypothetical protein [Vicinamibacterales bacterium]
MRTTTILPSLLAAALGVGSVSSIDAQTIDERPITGELRLRVTDDDEPTIRMSAHRVWFPLEEYPFDQLGQEGRVRVDPTYLAAYVNFACGFEGWVQWRYEEVEIEVLDDDRVRRRLGLERDEQGGFYNNSQKFKCELVTRNERLNAYLAKLVTMGGAPVSGFQFGLVQVVYMRMINEINTMERVPGSWGDYLYETFKSLMTFDLMDEDTGEIDLFFSPDGQTLEYEISRGRTVRLER